MSLDVSAVDLERYRAFAQARLRSERARGEARRQRAWRLARDAIATTPAPSPAEPAGAAHRTE